MNVSHGARLASLILLIGSTAACLNTFPPLQKPRNEPRQSEPIRQVQTEQKREHEKSTPNFSQIHFEVGTETGKAMNDAYVAFLKEDFEWLEREFDKARKEKTRLYGGYWKVSNMYSGLSGPSEVSGEGWTQHFERLNRWKETFPDSVTVRIALAESWTDYAWVARGGGYANTVTEEGRRLFKERICFALQELLEAKKLEQRCPQWYDAMMTVALAQGWSFEEHEAIYREAVQFEPHYYYYALTKSMYLLPRWHGAPGQWEAFVEQASNEIGGTEGLILYYLVVSENRRYFGDSPYDGAKVSMEKAKQGYYALKKTYGADRQRLNEFAKFACLINDYPAANEAFEEIGDKWLEATWRSKVMFDQYKTVAAFAKKNQDKKTNYQ